jgi:hypothetical protein
VIAQPCIKVGDLVKVKGTSSSYLTEHCRVSSENITGVVVGVTLDDTPADNSQHAGSVQEVDYWVRVVFLDNTKATLFHDEVEIVSTRKDKK